MPVSIRDSYEARRGCGYRKPGGLYLAAEKPPLSCGLLPIILDRCPTCNAGIRPTPAFQWIAIRPLIDKLSCRYGGSCIDCYLRWGERTGLLWIGEKFYRTTDDFMAEARRMGISRRIPKLPRGFKVGAHWIMFAHRKAKAVNCPDCIHNDMIAKPNCKTCKGTRLLYKGAIFSAFCPSAVEYVVRDDDPDEKLERLEKRGVKLVRVHPIIEDNQTTLNEEEWWTARQSKNSQTT